MKYLTATGEILAGELPIDIIVGLKEANPEVARLALWDYLLILSRQIHSAYGEQVEVCGFTQLLDHMEQIGFLLKIEG